MNPHIKVLEHAQMTRAMPAFRTGDTLLIQLKVKETSGEGSKQSVRERLQPFEGVVLGGRKKGLNSTVILHRVLEGEGIQLVLPLYSPLLASLVVKRPGDIRQAKIYYLKHLRGKAARIKQKYAKKLAPVVTPVVDSPDCQ